jgi:hypothetical protein
MNSGALEGQVVPALSVMPTKMVVHATKNHTFILPPRICSWPLKICSGHQILTFGGRVAIWFKTY